MVIKNVLKTVFLVLFGIASGCFCGLSLFAMTNKDTIEQISALSQKPTNEGEEAIIQLYKNNVPLYVRSSAYGEYAANREVELSKEVCSNNKDEGFCVGSGMQNFDYDFLVNRYVKKYEIIEQGIDISQNNKQ